MIPLPDVTPPASKKAKTMAAVPVPLVAPVIPPAPLPAFIISCMYIGQGDCILIKTPGTTAKYILIDCGNTAGIGEMKDKDTLFCDELKKRMSMTTIIDFLILTHSDADHHNRIGLLKQSGITVKEVIIGNVQWYDLYYKIKAEEVETAAAAAAAKLTGTPAKKVINAAKTKARNAKKNEFKKMVSDGINDPAEYWGYWKKKYKDKDAEALQILHEDCKCTSFTGLTLNKDNKVVKKYKVTGGVAVNVIVDPGILKTARDNGYYTVYRVDDPLINFSISIIAAEVESRKSAQGAYMNTSSLVTLLDIGGKRALFTGDATGATFIYLLDSAPVEIKNLFTTDLTRAGFALLQVPHHGSATFDSNYARFITQTRPVCLFSSVKFDETKHHLPRWASLGNWKRSNNNKIATYDNKDHYIGYWITKEELKRKRIGPKVNQNDHLTDAEVTAFLTTINTDLEAHGSNEDFNLYTLKEGALPSSRVNSLFVLNRAKKNEDDYFVIQFTKKAITTNGSQAVTQFLQSKVDTAKAGSGAKVTVKIKTVDLVKEAFNNLSAVVYEMNRNEIFLMKEIIARPPSKLKRKLT